MSDDIVDRLEFRANGVDQFYGTADEELDREAAKIIRDLRTLLVPAQGATAPIDREALAAWLETSPRRVLKFGDGEREVVEPSYLLATDVDWLIGVLLNSDGDAVAAPTVCEECGKPAGSDGDKCFGCFVYNHRIEEVAQSEAPAQTEGDRGAEPAEVGQLHEAMDLLHKARLSSIHHATDKAALRKALEHIAELYIRAPGFAAPDPTTELVYGMYRTACDALRALGASTVASTDRGSTA